MIQQFYFWLYTQNWKQGLKQIFVHPCSSSPKGETTQMFVNRLTDEQNVVHPYNGLFFSRKEEENWYTLQCG